MKPGIPWSVKGIEPETREAAKDAARRSGMTLGEWLNSKILDSADEQDSAPPLRHQRASPARAESSIRLEDIAEQLSRIARREQNTAPASYASENRLEDEENFARILNRVESNERQTVEAFTAVNERLAVLSRQVLQTAKMPTISKPEESAPFKSLESAVRNIVEHIEISERRTRDSLKSMQDRMADMAQRATSSSSEEILQSAPAFTSLQSRLNELASRVERSESKSDVGLSEILRLELSQLAERIETVRESSELLASKAQTAAVQTSQAELREIEKRILSLLKEAQIAFSGQGGNTNIEMQRLRSEIGALNQRIDSARADTASERDVHALRVAVEQLSTRVAQGPDMRPLADMDKRLVDITQRLDQSQQAARNNPQFSDLERRMAELDYRLEEAMRSQGDSQSQIALEQKISEVADRLGQTEHQLGHLETIERAITQLYEHVDQNRNMAREIAEDAANRMAERIMGGQAPAQALAPGPSPELQALEEGLRAVRETAASAELRNQETLEAVHETLEQIVVKLTELETASAGHQLALSMVQQAAARPPEPQSHYLPPPEPPQASYQPPPEPQYAPPSPEPVPAPNYEPQAAAPEYEPQVDTPAYEPPPRPQNPFLEQQSPVFQTQVPPVAAMPPHMAASALDPAMGDDFIDAARRAAQAAQHNVEFVDTASAIEAGRKAVNRKSGFKLPFLNKTAKPQAESPAAPKVVPILDAPKAAAIKRRKLLIAGIVLLAAVSAVTYSMLGRSAKKSPQPASIEDTAGPKAELPLMPGASVTAIFIDPLAAAASEVFTGSLPPQKANSSATMVSLEELPREIGSESLRKAAAKGNAVAQFVVAGRYLDGKPVPQDFVKAAYWYREAAARGLAPAQYRIATLFERGKGVTQDLASALLWYERAAAAGHTKSMHNAAVIAAGGTLGKPDYERAFKWFSAAAAHGLKDSQFNLAVLYERGLGTKSDPVEALFWYALAGRQNDMDAKTRAVTLMSGLQSAAARAVQQRIDAWTPKPAIPEANSVTVTDTDWQYDSGGQTGSLQPTLARTLAG